MDSTGPLADKIFTSYDVQMCLFDEPRVELFRQGILAAVRPGDVVVDCGSGTGLLGMFAAQAGAARVYCVEMSDDYVEIIRENARRNGLGDRIIAVQGDATSFELPEPVDVIVAEVLSAGFFYEPQVQIVNNMRRFLRPGGRMVPDLMENHVELIHAQESMYGLRFDYEPRWKTLPGDVALTDRVTYLNTDFYAENDPVITADVNLIGTRTGAANAIRVTYTIRLAAGIESSEPTEFLLNPQIIFLDEKVDVLPGQPVTVSLSYEASSNPRHCKVTIFPSAGSAL